ncbi:GNAT family N-acetyltransferase [Stigmatella sp. ncwal1]|uniref:GNAT family N-acetyltransferase n=1 Tax=Stigmatella ashevillensis TaxID=2995309 RepID=A0ABT5D9R2_9BACT|nr:GNAT family N-acetyltransferase [Stigmatella ashevillena]MDC0710301.1 GNAT family N-acetyltransferase [Stigmatella ashevillena]
MTTLETSPTHVVRIRPAALADAATLTEIGARTFRDTFAADNTPEDVEAFLASHYRPEIQEAELKDPRNLYLLAEVSGVPAGFALLRDGAREQGVQTERPLNLSRLYVDRPFLGVRVGAALMLRCLEEGRTRRHDVLWLGVWERNARARAFYSRWGFTEVGEMHFLLGNDLQRDLVLVLAL